MKRRYACGFVFLMLALASAVSVYGQYEDYWERYSGGEPPAGAVLGGYEEGGVKLFVCRARYMNVYYAGKMFDGRCYFSDGYRERSQTRFDVLTDAEFLWRRTSDFTRGVIVDNRASESLFICRVSSSGGQYPGYISNNRCNYTRGGRDYTSGSYDLLQGTEIAADILTAADNGNIQALRAALREGQRVDRRDDEGRTPLMLAAGKGFLEVARELVSRRASLNVTDSMGNTALILAAAKGQNRMARFLLDEGASARIRNNDGETALIKASSEGHERVVEELINDRTFVGMRDPETVEAFLAAARNGKEDVLEMFLEFGMMIEARDYDTGRTALMEAAAGKHSGAVELLLRRDANINSIDATGYTAFQLGVVADSDNVLKVFMRELRLIRPDDPEAEKGLQNAARLDKKDSLEFLIEQGVDVNNYDPATSYTALMWAAGEGHEGATEELLKAGARADMQNKNGETALMLAAANSKTNTLKELIKAGASLNIRDNSGRTALGWAIFNRHDDTRKELQKAGAEQ